MIMQLFCVDMIFILLKILGLFKLFYRKIIQNCKLLIKLAIIRLRFL